MKRFLLICVLVVVTGLGLTYTKSSAQEKIPKLLIMGTMPAGTLVGVQGTGISDIIGKYSPTKVKLKSVTSEEVWVPMLLSDEVDLGIAVSVAMHDAYYGTGSYRQIAQRLGVKGFPVRLVTVGSPIRISLLVQGDKPFKQISDLKGKTIVWFPKDTPFDQYTRALLANAGLEEKDVKKFPQANPAEAVRSVMDGSADACMVGVDAPAVAEAVATVNARWLPVDPEPEAIKRMQSVISTTYVSICPGGEHVGVPVEQKFMTLDVYMVGNASLSDAATFEITKALWDHDSELTQRPMLKEWVTRNFVSTRASVPYHPGAVKFYKEKGAWSKEMDELQNRLLTGKP